MTSLWELVTIIIFKVYRLLGVPAKHLIVFNISFCKLLKIMLQMYLIAINNRLRIIIWIFVETEVQHFIYITKSNKYNLGIKIMQWRTYCCCRSEKVGRQTDSSLVTTFFSDNVMVICSVTLFLYLSMPFRSNTSS